VPFLQDMRDLRRDGATQKTWARFNDRHLGTCLARQCREFQADKATPDDSDLGAV
jgi:hypothetical protein